jgi:tight adherence protein C
MDILNYFAALSRGLVDDPVLGRALFLAFLAAAAFMLVLATMLLISWAFRPEKERLRELGPALGEAGTRGSSMGKFLAASGEKVQPKLSATRSRYQNMLIMAGYRGSGAISLFYGIRLLAMFLLPLLAFFAGGLVLKLPTASVMLFAAAAFIAGLLLPALILEKQMKNRQKRLSRGLPDALDLLVVCTEAGLGLKPALQRVANDLYVSHPELAEELALVNAQTRVGIENIEALRDLADRTGIPEMRSLVAALSQSMRFGTSLAETLRIYSEDLRDRRLQAAEELAAKVSTKMLFPLIFCVFPSFLVVALGPPLLGALAALRATGKY